RALLEHIDAVNVDLKAFTAQFYDVASFAELQPVLDTLQLLAEQGVWFEIVNLVIPTLNDDLETIREMCRWIRDNLGDEVPVHFNRFFPAYKLTRLPPTPVETLESARRIALEEGLRYVYIGNVPGHPANSTYCAGCNRKVIGRTGFAVTEVNLDQGSCASCGRELPGIWN
ncbi:MAG: AmmeMemoRadiSam system radical SAM enzyme, partial [Spirochaetaceae bacterium]